MRLAEPTSGNTANEDPILGVSAAALQEPAAEPVTPRG
jgi:hypothetical protein